MTLAQLQAIYSGSFGIGHIEGLQAVFLTGYYLGKNVTPPSNVQGVVPALTAPTASQTVSLSRPDLR